MELLRIQAVTAVGGYTVEITLSNGDVRRVDLQRFLSGPAFDEIRDPAYFKTVRVDRDTIGWPNGIQLCPEDLIYTEAEWKALVESRRAKNDLEDLEDLLAELEDVKLPPPPRVASEVPEDDDEIAKARSVFAESA